MTTHESIKERIVSENAIVSKVKEKKKVEEMKIDNLF